MDYPKYPGPQPLESFTGYFDTGYSSHNFVDLKSDDVFNAPLVPPDNQCPTFDIAESFAFSQDLLESSAPTSQLLQPVATASSTPHGRKSGSGARIPRPRNAFILYRSSFAAHNRIPTSIEHDHRHICRIIANCWNNLSEEEKQVWRDKADTEKAEHARKYPDYRFSPVQRLDKPTKRKVRRNGEKEVDRCRVLANLLLSGKEGEALETAVKEIDSTRSFDSSPPPVVQGWEPVSGKPEEVQIPPFMSPLLPPTCTLEAPTPQYPSVADTDYVKNRAYFSLVNASSSDRHTLGAASTRSDFQRTYQGYMVPSDSEIPPLDLSPDLFPKLPLSISFLQRHPPRCKPVIRVIIKTGIQA